MVTNCDKLRTIVMSHIIENTRISTHSTGCKVELPLLEANGDSINVYVEPTESRFLVHDGGHINGMLFEAGPAGASQTDRRTIIALLGDLGLAFHSHRGIVFTEVDEQSLGYWVLEVGKAITLAGSMIPRAGLSGLSISATGTPPSQDVG